MVTPVPIVVPGYITTWLPIRVPAPSRTASWMTAKWPNDTDPSTVAAGEMTLPSDGVTVRPRFPCSARRAGIPALPQDLRAQRGDCGEGWNVIGREVHVERLLHGQDQCEMAE